MIYPLFISCPGNMEYLLGDELKNLGLLITKTSPMGIYGEADLETLYKICLWSRIANRVQLILFKGYAANQQELYQTCHHFDWEKVFTPDKTLAIEFHGESDFMRNSMYGALLVKDAIVDYFKARGERPNIDKLHPDIRLHAFLKHDEITVSLDLLGYSMHQRAYRQETGGAPIKENVAAALLIRAGWPELAEKGWNLVDPFCGSGTLLIEAALMATHTAPGLLRNDSSLENWQEHDAALWDKVRSAAEQERRPIKNIISGFDNDYSVIMLAKDNAEAAGMSEWIRFEKQAIEDYHIMQGPGLFIANPPYGERLEDTNSLIPVYQNIGKALHQHAQGWQAAILTSNPELAQAIGLRSDKQYNLYNGPLKVKLYCFNIDAANELRTHEGGEKPLSPYAEVLFNRLTKNKKHLDKWLKRTGHTCYRLYDADIPEYAMAVDVYHDWAHVQEYAPPKTVDEDKARKRVLDMLAALPRVLNIPSDHIALKQRQRQKGKLQYQSFDNKKQTLLVREGRATLKVNLYDYLDTGLFLDHRPLRLKFAESLRGKRFLNCFCYTAAVSVQAALAGAVTTNVDLSNTYLDWAEDNFELNNLPMRQHQFIRADCTHWLKECHQVFDVIFLDPPSFSNSKSMLDVLDIQRDHEILIDDAVNLLAREGVLYFSTNLKKFKLATSVMEKYQVKDITYQTLDEDFKDSKAHYCYLIEKKA